MAEDAKISRSLKELNRLTGLNLVLEGGNDDGGETLEKLSMLTAAYRDRYDRTNFVRNLLYGNVHSADIYAAASRFHIPESGRRVLYVIECPEGEAERAEHILKALFLRESGDLQAVLDEKRAVLIRQFRAKDTEEDKLSLAHMIVDMLNSEAMIKVRVGYGGEADSLKAMPDAFREAVLSLEIGRIFYSSETVLHYAGLGIGRLIYDLPEASSRLFLKELFGDGSPDDFDEETKSIINAFFDNNLNIAETARQLYVHRNTLVYRLEKLHQMTGLDLRVFDDAIAMKLAMMINSSLNQKKTKTGGSPI